MFPIFLLILAFPVFKSEPPLPPSKVQAEIRANKVSYSMKEFWKSYKILMTDKYFLLLSISFGINLGVYISFCTMLNQIILEYFAVSINRSDTNNFLLKFFANFIAECRKGRWFNRTTISGNWYGWTYYFRNRFR